MNHLYPFLISAIVAMTEERVIGKHNQLPWHLPADLKHFKTLTSGHPIVMGRKTYESIGKPLPNRINIILSKNHSFRAPGCMVTASVEETLTYVSKNCTEAKEIFIIGGAAIYQQWLPLIERIYLTIVHHPIAGDTYFPELNLTQWQEIERISYPADAANSYAYSFVTLIRPNT